MPLWPNFCGGTYQARSEVIAADQAINVYLETRQVPGSPKQGTFYGTPGLRRLVTVASTSCRGWFTQDGRTFAVVGDTLYEVDVANGTADVITTVLDDGAPVSFASNGQGGDQLGMVSGGALYVLDLTTDATTVVTLPFTNPVMIAFLDGYALINQANTPIVWYSALEDMTSWDALDFFARSGTSDNIVGIGVSRDRIWCFGTATTTLFYDSGDVDTPFVPYPGTVMQVGLVGPWAMAIHDDVFVWVTQHNNGQARVVRASDPQAAVISTPPIARFLGGCSTLSDVELLPYQQEDHTFYALTAPSSPEDVQTYVYDAREQLWHARAGWNATQGVYTRWRARGCVVSGDAVLVGDYANGDLYVLDLDTYDDDGDILKRERTAPYISAENQWVFIDQIELGMQAGVGLSSGQGSDPVVALEISRDGARTWVSAGTATLGAIGDAFARAIWRRLGRARSDRLVVKVTQTDPVKCVWGPGLWIKATPGTGQL